MRIAILTVTAVLLALAGLATSVRGDVPTPSAPPADARPAVAAPADTAAVPAGDRLTWGEEPLVAVSTTRTEVVLNGLWQFVPNAGEKPSDPTGGWGWMRVPGSWRHGGWPGVHSGLSATGAAPAWRDFGEGEAVNAGWYQRPLRVPASWAGKRVVLDLERVSTDATVYLDGRPVGEVTWPTGRVDLTAAIKPGVEQQLRVLVLSSAGAAEFTQFMGTATEQVTKTKAVTRARGLIGDVTLTCLPGGPEISEVFAKPTVEGGTRLDLEVTVDGATKDEAATLEAVLSDTAGNVVGTYTQAVRVAASPTQVLTAGWPVQNVRLWDFAKPNLYHVEVALRGSSVADTHRVRFGFRQIRIDGRKFILNGTEVRLRPNLSSIATNGALVFPTETREHIAFRRRQGYNLTELWPGSVQRRGSEDYQSVAARVADEEGWFITGILPHIGDSISATGVNEAEVRAGARAYRRLRNHPSIIFWGSSGNYFGHNTDQDPRMIGRRGFADADPAYLKRAKAGNAGLAIYREMDGTRPQFTHHGGDVGDIHTANNYLNLMPLQEREEWLSEWGRTGTMPFWPVEFETPLNLSLMRDRNNHENADTSEPFLSEYCASYFGEVAYAEEPAEYRKQMVEGYVGKDRWRFRSVSMDTAPAFQRLQVLNQRAIWRSWRALGATMLGIPWHDGYSHRTAKRVEAPSAPFVAGQRGPWLPVRRNDVIEELPAFGALSATNPQGAGGPTLAYIAHAGEGADLVAKDHHAVAGDTVAKAVLLINDEREPKDWTATWTAVRDGTRVGGDSAKGRLDAAARTTVPVSTVVPADSARGAVTITLEATIGDRQHRDEFVVQVYPRTAAATGAVLAVDPAGASTKALTALGYTVTAWDGKPAAGRVVVVGRHAFADAAARAMDFAAHVAAGGRVVVMAQERAWYEQDQGLRTAAWSSRRVFTVPTQTSHPVIAGLGDVDLRDWNGAGSGVPSHPQPVYEKESHGYPRHGWKWGNTGTVAGLSIEKPHHGSWRPLLQCEFDLAFSPLLELSAGNGLMLWCTLDLEDRSRRDPVADLLLGRLIAYAKDYAGEPARRPAALIGDTGRVAGLRLLGAADAALPADHRPVVIGPDAAVDDAALRAWITAGGRALVLADAERTRLGFTVAVRDKHLGSLTPPAWPEARGLGASDLRLRNHAAVPALTAAPADGVIAADGLLGRLALGKGVAVITTIDPAQLPAADQPWFRGTQWRWTRTLAQLAANLGIAARGDGKAVLADLRRDAPRPLAGNWRMLVEQNLPPTTPDKPHAPTPLTDRAPLTADTSKWMAIGVPGAWESTPTQFDGAVWVRRAVDVPADWAGQELVVDLGSIDDHDQTWFNGERIGGIGKENPDAYRTPRSYRVKPELVRAGRAVIAVRVFDWFGTGTIGDKEADMTLRRADGQGQKITLAGVWQGTIESRVAPATWPGELQDPGVAAQAAEWHRPAFDDRGWQPIRLPQPLESAFADIDGAVWLRTTVDVPAHWAGRDLELNLGPIADADTTFAGGAEIGQGTGRGPRRYVVPAAVAKAGPLAIAVRVFNQAGPGGFLGQTADLTLALPDDVAGTPWYEPGYRTVFATGDDPFRYYRW